MRINAGGRLSTRDVVGRYNEIARYWRVVMTPACHAGTDRIED